MITFPTTSDAFIAYQEAGAGCTFGKNARYLLGKITDVLNGCFEAGKAGRPIPWQVSGEEFIEFMAERGYNEMITPESPIIQYLQITNYWSNEAYKQGQEATE